MELWRGRGTRFVSEEMGATVWKGYAGGVDWSVWFDHFYQARGAANYAASLLDLVGAANLVEGNGAVPWDAVNGWQFNAAAAQWLDTGLIPASDQSWSMLVQYENWANAAYIAAMSTGAARSFGIRNLGAAEGYYNGQNLNAAPHQATGNLGVAGDSGYRNGLLDASPIPPWVPPALHSIYIGCRNAAGVAAQFATANIYAVGIKEGPALTAPEVAAAAAAMALI